MKTPKTLTEAIGNGLSDLLPEDVRATVAAQIEPHVLHFLAQKFSGAFFDSVWDGGKIGRLKQLWEDITGCAL